MLSSGRSATLVLGLGNILLGDDGLGIHALRRLVERYRLPSGVSALDGGVLGLALAAHVATADSLLVLDAIRGGRTPGTLVSMSLADLPRGEPPEPSAHRLGLASILGACALAETTPRRMVVMGLEPELVGWRIGLSDATSLRLDDLVDAAARQLRSWGLEVSESAP